jgi:hypothetical protein
MRADNFMGFFIPAIFSGHQQSRKLTHYQVQKKVESDPLGRERCAGEPVLRRWSSPRFIRHSGLADTAHRTDCRVEPLFMIIGSTSVDHPPALQAGFYCGYYGSARKNTRPCARRAQCVTFFAPTCNGHRPKMEYAALCYFSLPDGVSLATAAGLRLLISAARATIFFSLPSISASPTCWSSSTPSNAPDDRMGPIEKDYDPVFRSSSSTSSSSPRSVITREWPGCESTMPA